MNIQSLSDEALLSQIKLDAAQERRSSLAVIHQLREVARRRLDAKLGYDSLHKYCMEELHYSPGSAWRRINAMRALRDIPELESQIESGAVTVATVSQVESFCRREKKSKEEKRVILNQIEGRSKRETERLLAEIAPLPERSEKVRVLNAATTEIRVTLHAETLAALDHIKNLISHARPNATYGEAIDYLAKLGVKKLDPQVLTKRESAPSSESDSRPRTATHPTSGLPRVPHQKWATQPPSSPDPSGSLPRPNLSLSLRRAVWRRDGGECTYVSPGGKKCGSQTFVQIDHILPRAKGGPDKLKNLRIRCRAHNLLAAVEEFGQTKIDQYLTHKRVPSMLGSA